MKLKDLKAVDWYSLSAGYVPVWIVGLTSADNDIRLHAALELSDYFRKHNAGLNVFSGYKELLSTDAPIVAIHFLVDLLASDDIQNKAILLDILIEAVNYRKIDILDEAQQRRANIIYQYLLGQVDLFLQFLNSKDNDCRITVMDLLSYFDEEEFRVIDSILRNLAGYEYRKYKEQDPFEKIVATGVVFRKIQGNYTLHRQFSKRFEDILQQWVSSHFEHPSVHANAAFYLIKLRGNNIERSIVKILSNTLKVANFDQLDLPLFDDCIEAFMQLGSEYGTDILLDIFDDQTNAAFVLDLATLLLGINFGAEDYRQVRWIRDYFGSVDPHLKTVIRPAKTPFNKLQQRILEHFIAKDELWKIETNLFKIFELPSTKDGLLSLTESNNGEVE